MAHAIPTRKIGVKTPLFNGFRTVRDVLASLRDLGSDERMTEIGPHAVPCKREEGALFS